MKLRILSRCTLALVFALALIRCGGTETAIQPTSAPLATERPTTPPTAPPRATSPPTAPPPPTTSRPTSTATTAPSATPAPTMTAIPTATATPAPPNPPQPERQALAHYAFPVRSEGEISYGRTHHDYPAADIFCPVGSEFVAVTDGVVDFVSWEDRWDPAVEDGATNGGLSVAIIGDDGVRYYGSHLSAVAEGIEPGVRVAAGQTLGLTGKSGNARDTDPHLHFGISRPTTPDDWAVRRGEVAPYEYLRAWQRGEDVRPELPR